VLAFRDVSRRYGRVRALDGVSFALEQGHVLALLGANGAGKSTLLRLAATIERPDAGAIRFGDDDAADDGAAARRHVAYLGQDPGLYGDLTVRENAALVASFHDKAFALEPAAKACGIAHKLDERARTLSRGERQRAALLRTLCGGEVLMLDEPTTALDAAGRAQVCDLLAELRGRRTVLVATHDEQVLALADRAIVLERGRVTLDASADDGRRWLEAFA
jgi:ABC-type multidrug transport system ATPase subunit